MVIILFHFQRVALVAGENPHGGQHTTTEEQKQNVLTPRVTEVIMIQKQAGAELCQAQRSLSSLPTGESLVIVSFSKF